MRKLTMVATVTVFAVLSLSSVSHAESYISAYIGGAVAHDSDIFDNDTSLSGVLGFDSGISIGAKIGTWSSANPYLGVQLDLNGHYPATSTLTTQGIEFNLESDVSVVSLTANALLRYPEGNIKPYVGIGSGYFSADIDPGVLSGFGQSATVEGGSDSTFGWQVLAGIDFTISPNLSFFGEYKYSEADFKFNDGIGSEVFYEVSQIYGGLSYRF